MASNKVSPDTSEVVKEFQADGNENNKLPERNLTPNEHSSPEDQFAQEEIKGEEGFFTSSLATKVQQKVIPDRSDELVFYDSARSKRSCVGSLHYCLACPGWNKATNMRIVYSTWEWTTCCCIDIPSGRQLDTFDADIIVDLSATQSCLQICRGEGDMHMWRLSGGDMSSESSEIFTMTDVSNIFDVFSDMTFELSKINLKDAASMGLGRKMGSTLGYDPANNVGALTNDMSKEKVFYDTLDTKRTLLGSFMHLDCCLQPIYKLTSERVMYVEWDVWHPCDNPISSCIFLPYYILNSCLRDICCGMGGGNREKSTVIAANRIADKVKDSERSWLNRNCVCPVGRTAHFFDLDLVVDIGAHQQCSQLIMNEGDLLLYRIGNGADASSNESIFKIKNVPEVFSKFDDISYDLSKMNLKSFRQNTLAQKIIR